MADTQRALKAPPAYSELAGSVRWLRANPILAAGVLLIAAQLWWQAGLLGRSFFRLDDYIYLEHASTSGLTWSYLTWVDAGHLDVVGSAIVWALVRISPEDWTLATAATLVLLGCTCFAFLRMLRTLFGDRPGILLLLSLYLLSPLALPGLSWWTVTLELLPLQLALFCAVTAHAHYLRTGGFKHVAAAAAWLAVGMLSSFQGAAVPFLLFAMTSAFFAPGAWSRALWPALREHWRTWTLYIALTAAYVVLYLLRLRTSSAGLTKPATFADALTFAGTLLRDTFVPGAFGGPWRWASSGVEALADPPPALAWASWVLAVIVVLASLMYGWRAWRAWAILAGWLIVVDVVPVLAGWSSLVSGVVLGLSARYVWDASGILILCAGLAFMPLADGPEPVADPASFEQTRVRGGDHLDSGHRGWLAVVVLRLPNRPGGCGSRRLHRHRAGSAGGRPERRGDRGRPDSGGRHRRILRTGHQRLARAVPAAVRARPGRRTAAVFITQPNGTYDHLLEFDGFGRLVPSGIYGASSPPVPAGGACWADTFGDVAVPLSHGARPMPSTLRIGYLAGSPAQVLITFGTQKALYNVERGLHAAYFPISSGDNVAAVVIQQVSGPVPCIGNVQAGVLLPSEAGPAIPPFAVAG